MCGNHDAAGQPLDHSHESGRETEHHHPPTRSGSNGSAGRSLHVHGPSGRGLTLPAPRARSRRAFLGEFGKGTVALAVFTPLLAACGGSNDSGDGDAGPSDQADDGGAGTDGDASTTTAGDSSSTNAGSDDQAAAGGELRWARANLGFVSAYVLARGNSAAIVDTGTSGSADTIGETLSTLGLTYDDVDHVILTHKHGDHIGSITEVLGRATSAAVYAGEADLSEIDADSIVSLTGGEDVFGFEMLATPGHTAGHMAVIDHTTGLLVAGDAVFAEGGAAVEGPERFFEDVAQSQQTIRDLAMLSFNVMLPGHGDPIESGADAALAELAASLP